MIRSIINAFAWLILATLIALQWDVETQAMLLWSYHGLFYGLIFAVVMFLINLILFVGNITREMSDDYEYEPD